MVLIDLSTFFERVYCDRSMSKVNIDLSDKEVLRQIRRYLQSWIMINRVVYQPRGEIPKRGNISPILSNKIWEELDKKLESRGRRFIRYAEDIIIFKKSSSGRASN